MTGSIVPLTSFANSVEANMAKGALEAQGISCSLHDEEMVNMQWQMTNAFGGIKLMVREADVFEARRILVDRDLLPEARNSARSLSNEEWDPQDELERWVDRAFRAAVIGIVFFPLQFYVTWILWCIYHPPERLDGGYRIKVVLAFLINVTFWAISTLLFGLFVLLIIGSFL